MSTQAPTFRRWWRLAIGRRPTPDELAALVDGFTADRATFVAAPDRAEQFVAVGLVKKPDALPASELAAYSLAANVILNLDEFVMRE
jgi:hypothetical protein